MYHETLLKKQLIVYRILIRGEIACSKKFDIYGTDAVETGLRESGLLMDHLR